MDIYEELLEKFQNLVEKEGLEKEEIAVDIKSLTPTESIGNPKRKDFPLLTGKEAMVEANFKGAKGQAFTLSRSTYQGRLNDVLNLDLSNNYNKAIFLSTLNAVLKYLGLIDHTVHCKDEEPETCAFEISRYMEEHFQDKKIVLIGYQPAILEALTNVSVELRILDLNPINIGEYRYGVLVEDGEKDFEEITQWGDVFLVTGSTLANGSIVNFLNLKQPVIFYGNTIAGAAYLLHLPRLCFKAS
ncbi:MAG: DUF364 domain-containing protein [Tissierellia bacterium]|nr:DUF364 domain-containing protein [Tissierellia bacterium]